MHGEILQFAGSLLAVILLVALTYFLGFRQSATLQSESEARELFGLAPGGFEPVAIALDISGAAAIARDSRGRIAVLVPHGNQFVVRPLETGTKITAQGDELRIEGMPQLRLEIEGEAEVWATTDIDASNA